MGDIFQIASGDFYLTGGVYLAGGCYYPIDGNSDNKKTLEEAGAQNYNDQIPFGYLCSYTFVTGCLTGTGTVKSPISIQLQPNGGIMCGASGLYINQSGTATVSVGNCLSGDGTNGSPIELTLDPSGYIECGPSGLRYTGPTGVSFDCSQLSSCSISGLGDVTISSAASGDYLFYDGSGWINQPLDVITSVYSSGCLSGSGTENNPLYLNLDPTGLLTCGPGGLRYSGNIGLTRVTTGGCLSGSGTQASPLFISLDPTGLLSCGPSGLKYTGQLFSCELLSGCSLSGIGDVSLTNPTGGDLLQYSGGQWVNYSPPYISTVNVSGCVVGNGVGTPLSIVLDPTGLVSCGPSGLRFTGTQFSCADLNNCDLESLGNIIDGAVNGELLIFDGSNWTPQTLLSQGCITGNGYTTPFSLLIKPNSFLECTPSGLAYVGPTGVGGGSGVFECASLSACSINSLGDVAVAGAVEGQFLKYSAGFWVPETVSFNIVASGQTATIQDGTTFSFIDSSTIKWGVPASGQVNGHAVISSSGGNLLENLGGLFVCVHATGCVDGSGTLSDPLHIEIDPSGYLSCGANGLRYSGPIFSCDDLALCSISGLGDVVITTPTDNQVLTYNSAAMRWEDQYVNVLLGASGRAGITNIDANNITRVVLGDGVTTTAFASGNHFYNEVRLAGSPGILASGVDGLSALVNTSGCLGGEGTSLSPLYINIDPTGLLSCGPNGLHYTGPTGVTYTFSCTELNSCSINSLNDVATSGVVDGQALVYNGGTWTPSTPGFFITSSGDDTALVSNNSTMEFVDSETINFTVATDRTVTANLNLAISNCLQGDGTALDPLTIKLNPTGLLTCTVNGLSYTGPTGVTQAFNCSLLSGCTLNNIGNVSEVGATSGTYLFYNGTSWVPRFIETAQGSGTCVVAYSYESGNYPGGASEPNTPSLNASIQVEVYDDQINFWGNPSGSWSLDKTFTGGGSSFSCSLLSGCSLEHIGNVASGAIDGQLLSFSGGTWIAKTLTLNLDPNGGLECGPSGLRYVGPTGSGDGTNLYNANGTLTAPRTVTASNNNLTFNMGSGKFIVDGPFIKVSESAAPGDTTPTVATTSVLRLINTSGVTVTNFDNGTNDQELTVIVDKNTTIQHASGVIHLDNGINFAPSNGGSLTLFRDSGVWKEIARATY